MASIQQVLEDIAKPLVESLGYIYWGLELSGKDRASLVRIYIDAEAGISVEDCALVSRQLGALLDVEDPIKGEYVLEISSPGLDRRIFTLPQYAQCAGEQVQIKLRFPYEGQRRFVGLLKGIEADEVILQVDDEEFCFPFEAIDQARVQVRPVQSNKK